MEKRIKSIDIIRGLSVALMIVVNNPGTWSRNYIQLRHALWHGVTLADFAFPFFLISMGVAIPISINNKLSKGNKTSYIILDIIRRSVLIIAFGIFLNYLSNKDLNTIRIMGVLQRLGIVYLITSFIYLLLRSVTKNKKSIIYSLIGISIFIIVGYYIIAKPFGFEEQGNLAQIVDVYLLNNHLYNEAFDPEGLLTSIVSISSGTLGCAVGCIITNKDKEQSKRFYNLLSLGIICVVCAFIFNKYFPFNKRLWSSSFVLLTSGLYTILLALFYFISDIKQKYKIFTPIIALGSSPIFTYMSLEIISKTLWKVKLYSNTLLEETSLPDWITYDFITPHFGEVYDSLIFSLIYLAIWTIVMMIMYSQKIYIKI